MNAEELARRIEAEAAIADRPGQSAELDRIAARVRALAGAPTADGAAMRVRLDEALSSYYGSLTQSAIDDIIAKTFAAAPEGVDAADEQAEDSGEAAHLAEMTRQSIARALDTGEQLVWDDGAVSTVTERLEAQGAMAVELTAARAAIQRVREKHRPDHEGDCEECYQTHPCRTVRALDGDTTEEKR